MPAAACTIPSGFATILVRPLVASRRTVSRSTSARRAVSRSSGSAGTAHEAALDLREHLRRHDHHVAVGQGAGEGVGQRRGEVVAGPELRQAGDAPEGQPVGGVISCHRRSGSAPLRGRRRDRRPRAPSPPSRPGRSSSAAPRGPRRPAPRPPSPGATSQPSSRPPVVRAPYQRPTPSALTGTSDRRQARLGHPAHGVPADDRRDPDDPAGRGGERGAASPGTSTIVWMLTTGFDGATSTTSASAIAASAAGHAVACSRPTEAKECAGRAARWRTHHSWKWMARRWPSAGSSTTTWVSIRSSLAGISSTPGGPAVAERGGDLRERVARAQHPGAHEVGGDVAVAEPEPRRVGAVGLELLADRPGLLRAAPAALGVDARAEGVHAGVEVRADPQAVQPDVVADVDHRADRVARRRRRPGRPAGTGRHRRPRRER